MFFDSQCIDKNHDRANPLSSTFYALPCISDFELHDLSFWQQLH